MLLMSTLGSSRPPGKIGAPLPAGPVAGSFDALVVGSGIGGLAAAALLAREGGRRVLVLERHSVAGGFTHTFRRPGFEWDVGVHYIGDVNLPGSATRAAFDYLTQGRLKWSAMPEVYDRLQVGGRWYDLHAGRERFRESMKAYFPEEARAIDAYLEAVARVVRRSRFFFAEKAIPGPAAAVLGGLLRGAFLEQADLTTDEVLRGLTGSAELRAVLAGQWGDYGMPPGESSFAMHAVTANHYMEGAGYPIGGSSEIAAGIAPLIEQAGGMIATRAEVAQILVGPGGHAIGVRLADGRQVRAPVVVSDAGAQATLNRLLPAELECTRALRGELARIPPSIAHLGLYVGLKRAEDEPEFGASNLWSFPGPDHQANVRRHAEDPSAPFPFVFVSFPSAKDPAFATRHPGKSTIEVIAPSSFDRYAEWADTRWKSRTADYESLKRDLTARLLAELERLVPSTRGRVLHAELSTPLSTRHFDACQHGEIYGLCASPARFRVRGLGTRTPVRNLYLAGQDAAVSGVTGALVGGVLAASAILRRNLMGRVFRPTGA